MGGKKEQNPLRKSQETGRVVPFRVNGYWPLSPIKVWFVMWWRNQLVGNAVTWKIMSEYTCLLVLILLNFVKYNNS